MMVSLSAQDAVLPLWPGNPPNQQRAEGEEIREETDLLRVRHVLTPDIAVFLPARANRTGMGVLIAPGGGYRILAYDWEGTDIAKWLNAHGIAAFVLKYRLPDEKLQTDFHEVPLIDAQRAMRLVRSQAADWGLKPDQIGVMGFSAGGHLAATLGTHFNDSVYTPVDAADELPARPDFMVLMYPVISFTNTAVHSGSREALLGKDPDPELAAFYSAELQVTASTPATILVHATDDTAVPPENSLLFYKKLKDMGVPSSMLLYARGGHGFSLAQDDPYLRTWPDQVISWLHMLPGSGKD